MNTLIQLIHQRARGDVATTVGFALSLLNVHEFGSPDAAEAAALSDIVGEAERLDRDELERQFAETPPLPDGFELPGRRFVELMRKLDATDEDRLEYLSTYFDAVARDPTYTMAEFVEAIEASLDDAAPDFVPGDVPDAAPEPDTVYSSRSTPPWLDPAKPAADDRSPIDVVFTLDLADVERGKALIEGPTDFASASPWVVEMPLTDKLQFNVEIRGDASGEPYFETTITDYARKTLYSSWPEASTPFGEFTHEILGRPVRVVVRAHVPVEEPVAAGAA